MQPPRYVICEMGPISLSSAKHQTLNPTYVLVTPTQTLLDTLMTEIRHADPYATLPEVLAEAC
jgi:hypothetical protein